MFRPIRKILVVEDNPADANLLMCLFREIGFDREIEHVADGESALKFLASGKSAHLLPELVLLDLNLPRMDGREVLRRIKQDDLFSLISVVVLSSSDSEQDVRQCYRLGANCYLTKPADLEDYSALLKKLSDFWCGAARVPQPTGASYR